VAWFCDDDDEVQNPFFRNLLQQKLLSNYVVMYLENVA
jgi:hypothetical protein